MNHFKDMVKKIPKCLLNEHGSLFRLNVKIVDVSGDVKKTLNILYVVYVFL
jgi:hypothetical protein